MSNNDEHSNENKDKSVTDSCTVSPEFTRRSKALKKHIGERNNMLQRIARMFGLRISESNGEPIVQPL